MKPRLPFVLAFVLGLAFLLLLSTFRSVVDPAHGDRAQPALGRRRLRPARPDLPARLGGGPLGFTSNDAITSWLPLFLFVILFGLSMDYHVFILSRIKELVDAGCRPRRPSAGIRRTAGTVTSAAIIMVAVFAIFGTLR